jgi:hypothetical protein
MGMAWAAVNADSTIAKEKQKILDAFIFLTSLFRDYLKYEDPVKSQKSRRSRGGGSPELLDLTRFPLSRE